MFKYVDYDTLKSRQQENYNFQKIAACLADYGFNCLRLSDDWQGADFLACHIDGDTFLKVQLKGRLTIDRKYQGKDIWIAFLHNGGAWVYPHDKFLDAVKLNNPNVLDTRSWMDTDKGLYSWPSPPGGWVFDFLVDYKIHEEEPIVAPAARNTNPMWDD